jgi:hypothetical protein
LPRSGCCSIGSSSARSSPSTRRRGFAPLIDREQIYAFDPWWERIQTLITQADTIVFVISPDAVGSDVCQKEVAFAASLNKRFAPVVCRRVDDRTVPEPLRRLNFIMYDDEARFDANMAQLADALTTDIEWVRKHTEFGEAARLRLGHTRRLGQIPAAGEISVITMTGRLTLTRA